jgi:glucosamine 6-phosphate synthetase-like amidotransferase/phosphosugar isomerase protein
MCGIAGYSLGEGSRADRTLAAQALLAGIAERGEDAVGYAHRDGAGALVTHKQQTGPSALLETLSFPSPVRQAILHVRDFTKGPPAIAANNHPVRHGTVVGVHNGIIENDDALFDHHGWSRHEPDMTVDSEIIFAVAEAAGSDAAALEQLHGAMAAAWMDERVPDTLFLARGLARPLWLGSGRHEQFFASTRTTLELVERALRMNLRMREVPEGRLLHLVDGAVANEHRWQPDRSYVDTGTLPAVRAPHEGEHCFHRLAALAAWSS